MLLLKFINDSTVYEVEANFNGTNLITITGTIPQNTSGFYLNRSLDYADDWDYTKFTTVYRVLDNGIQFSNDGSVYVAPEKVIPTVTFVCYNGTLTGDSVQQVEDYSDIVVPTVTADENYTFEGWSSTIPESGEIEKNVTYYASMTYVEPLSSVQERKISEMNEIQQTTIETGMDVTLTDGSVEHFTMTANDQISILGLSSQVAAGIEQIPWHTSDHEEQCKYYSNADMQKIIAASLAFVTYHVTFFRDLRIYINTLTSKEDVEAITYDIASLPQEHWSSVLTDIIAQQSAATTTEEE